MYLTHEGYAAKKGQVCPFCFGKDLEWGTLDATAQGARQFVHCNTCDKDWMDIHELVGFSEV